MDPAATERDRDDASPESVIGRTVEVVVQVVLLVVVGLGALLFSAVFQTVLQGLYASVMGEPSVVARWTIVYVSFALGMGTVGFGYLYTSNRGVEFLDVRTPSRRDVAWGIGGFVALLALLYGLGLLFSSIGIEQAPHEIQRAADPDTGGDPAVLLVAIPASLLVIGPAEELIFRNLVQKSLYEVFSRRGAIVVATCLFAALHFSSYLGGTPGQTIASLVSVFVLALVLGVVFERTENLVVVAVVHGSFNAVQFVDLYCSLVGCPVVG